MTRLVVVLIVFTALSQMASATGPASLPSGKDLEQSLEALHSTGNEYLVARAHLLSMDKTVVRSILEKRLTSLSDPVEILCLQAVIARLDNPGLDETLAKRFEEAGRPRSGLTAAGVVRTDPPDPWRGGWMLLDPLGDDAIALAAEMLFKDLLRGQPEWKRLSPVHTLWNMGEVTMSSGGRTQIRRPEIGVVLLRLVNQTSDDAVAAEAAEGLRDFASLQLLEAARRARADAGNGRRSEQLQKTVKLLESLVRNRAKAEQVVGPEVQTHFPWRFKVDGRRKLSESDKAELDRLVGLARDSKETPRRREQALRILGERVAHVECIQPLRGFIYDKANGEELRKVAVVALSLIPDGSAVHELIETLGSPEMEWRVFITGRFRLWCLTGMEGPHEGSFQEQQEAGAKWWRIWWQEHGDSFVPRRVFAVLQQ